MRRFAVWVPPDKRSDPFDERHWVLDNQSEYVTLENRGIWNTRKMAEQAIVEDWEVVIEIEEDET